MSWQVVNADARAMPIEDGSVDLIVTSPPYWGLRSYRDAGEHYDGQVGSEDTPQRFVDELVGILDGECRRVLKGSGSLWLNLGDKYAGSGGSGTTSGLGAEPNLDRGGNGQYPKGLTDARPKSLLGIPWRVALALIDAGWILRAEVIWSKPNGLPESVTDRVRRSHEQWFHFVKEPRYYSAVDRIREHHTSGEHGAQRHTRTDSRADETKRWRSKTDETGGTVNAGGCRLPPEPGEPGAFHALGRLPGSVRTVPTEPLIIPDEVKEHLGLVDHYAAFPQEWPRWIIEGWSPEKVCQVCGEGVRPAVEVTPGTPSGAKTQAEMSQGAISGGTAKVTLNGDTGTRQITGEACACDEIGPTKPGVVLDPFGGTGTTAGVAHALGRHGISIDLSADYCRLAEWRISQSGHFDKSRQRMWADRQEALL